MHGFHNDCAQHNQLYRRYYSSTSIENDGNTDCSTSYIVRDERLAIVKADKRSMCTPCPTALIVVVAIRSVRKAVMYGRLVIVNAGLDLARLEYEYARVLLIGCIQAQPRLTPN
eukprot:COSAG01_NODE_39432_length_476_cov_2.058355_1_plen_114_part_00